MIGELETYENFITMLNQRLLESIIVSFVKTWNKERGTEEAVVDFKGFKAYIVQAALDSYKEEGRQEGMEEASATSDAGAGYGDALRSAMNLDEHGDE